MQAIEQDSVMAYIANKGYASVMRNLRANPRNEEVTAYFTIGAEKYKAYFEIKTRTLEITTFKSKAGKTPQLVDEDEHRVYVLNMGWALDRIKERE